MNRKSNQNKEEEMITIFMDRDTLTEAEWATLIEQVQLKTVQEESHE